MGFVIAIFSWILKVLESAKNTILSVWGMVVAFLASLVASVQGLVSFFSSTNQVICSHIDSISDSVSSFFNSIPSSGGWGYFLYHILALDVANEWIFGTLATFLLAHLVAALSLFVSVLIISLVPSAIVLLRHLISIISAGFVKP